MNQLHFPFAPPSFDLFLFQDCALHGRMRFIPDQFLNAVSLRKSLVEAISMLPYSRRQIGGRADIYCAVSFARHDVRAGLSHKVSLRVFCFISSAVLPMRTVRPNILDSRAPECMPSRKRGTACQGNAGLPMRMFCGRTLDSRFRGNDEGRRGNDEGAAGITGRGNDEGAAGITGRGENRFIRCRFRFVWRFGVGQRLLKGTLRLGRR